MLQQRRQEIIAKIRQHRTVKVAELVREYGVSIETIRRDLEYLEANGYLKRVYGGAVPKGMYSDEPPYRERQVKHYEEKLAIAKAAARHIEDGDTLFVDVGTTTLEVARQLHDKNNLTVITNATSIASEAVAGPGNRVILLGGELRGGELSVSGFLAEQGIQNFYANKILMGVGGLDVKRGFTDYHLQEANLRRLMLSRSERVIALADYSKWGVTAINFVCNTSAVDVLITDDKAPVEMIDTLRGEGLEVVVAEQD